MKGKFEPFVLRVTRWSLDTARWVLGTGRRGNCFRVLFGLLGLVGLPLMGSASTFTWTLTKSGTTSAGIYDGQGRLTRVLWTMEEVPAGTHTVTWDGRDDKGQVAPPGNYSWKVVVNRAVYTNPGTVGNTGLPATSFGHVPFFLEGVAVDAQNRIYSVHDWNEAGHDIKRWNSATGAAEFHTGHIIGEALLKGIAVEPDGSRAYVTGYGDAAIEDRARIKFSLFRVNLADGTVQDFSQAGRSVLIYDGNAQYPVGATEADKAVMKVPVTSVAVLGNSVYVTDALAGRVLRYDKESGALLQTIPGIPLACGLAVGADGRIWVGHEHSKVSVFAADGTRLATPISDLTEVRALALRNGVLCVADREGQIRRYAVNGTAVTLTGTYGQKAVPGEKNPDRLSQIHGMTMDAEGGIILTDRIGQGGRLQKIDAQLTPVWQQMGLEFSSQAAYGTANPDLLVSSYRNFYQLNRATGQWTFLGPGGTDTPGSYFGHFESTHFGPPRVVRFGGNDFFYYPAGDGLAIYRIQPSTDPERGPTLQLASCLGGAMPSPDGQHRSEWWLDENRFLWSWDDTEGDGHIDYQSPALPDEVTLDASPGQPAEGWVWDKASMGVDDEGWVWLASYARLLPPDAYEAKAIYAIPPQGLNARGNPVYRWAGAVKVMDEATGRNALGITGGEFNWMMVNRSNDGMVYSLAYTDNGAYPQDGARWMGGNVLFAFEGQTGNSPQPLGAPKWHVVLPERSVGMTPIPGGPGGVFVGIGPQDRGAIGHYTRDGLLVGKLRVAPQFGDDVPPNLASGALDAFLAINCNRDPRDGVLDVFAEDNWNQRLVWYRVDDSKLETLTGAVSAGVPSGETRMLTVNQGTGDGQYPAGAVVNVLAALPPPGKAFKEWTGNTASLADPRSAATTLTMPASNVTITATYDWASGADQVRFYAREGDQHRMLNCVFEGTNGDPVTGPYTPFYVVTAIPASGWTAVSVDLANYRYLRFRDPNTNGMLTELEFYRNGTKLSGTGFGTPGSWNNEAHRTFAAALDGDLESYFNGPPGTNAFVGIDSAGALPSAHTLTVSGGTGGGSYETGKMVTISAAAPPAGSEFAGWTGDIAILANPLEATTTAFMPSMDVAVTASYTALPTVPPVLLRATLRQTHGDGICDLDVFGPGTVSNVEPRRPDLDGVRVLLLEFDQEVSTGTVTVGQGSATVVSAVFQGSTVTVTLMNVSDRQKVSLSLTGFAASGGAAMAATPLAIRFLVGDGTRDGQVNTVDMVTVRTQLNRTQGNPNFNPSWDFETDGIVNTEDMRAQRTNNGRSVAP